MNKILIRALNKLRILRYFNINGKIELNNKKFKIPILQKVGYGNLFMSEPWMIEILKIVLPIDNKGFLDVGVNIGQTLIKVRSVSSEIKYIGFEPNPMCVNYVSQLVKENDLKNVSIIPVGISDKTKIGVLNFFNSSVTDSTASMIAEFRPEQKIERKEYIPLFDLRKITDAIDLNAISVLKVDVEGAELEVLNSFYPLIKDHHPLILIEILPAYGKDNIFRIERQNKIKTMLINAEYSIFSVIKESEILLDLVEISNIEIHSDLNRCEYVMVPNVKKKEFENSCKQRLKRQ
jgi:FkbM family methyltransferase